MTKFKCRIEETLATTVLIEAESLEEAERKVREAYDACKIVLEADDFVDKEFEVQGLASKEDEECFRTIKFDQKG